MIKYEICLKTVEDVKDLVSILSTFPCDVDLSCGHYVVDAKSLLGILGLAMGKTATLGFISDFKDIVGVEEKLKKYIVTGDTKSSTKTGQILNS